VHCSMYCWVIPYEMPIFKGGLCMDLLPFVCVCVCVCVCRKMKTHSLTYFFRIFGLRVWEI